jgi:DNA adenine methylase
VVSAPPLPYFGGKQQMAARIAAVLPAHRHYVEPFAGSLAVLLAKPESVMETVNDLDADVVTFWRVLRDQPEALARVCALTPHSRQEHQDSYHRPEQLSDVERARRVWVCLTQGRGATLRRTGWRHYVRPTGGTGLPDYLAGYTARMPVAAARLARVSLECRPALEVIARYGAHPDVLLYVDPPYLGSTRGTTTCRATAGCTADCATDCATGCATGWTGQAGAAPRAGTGRYRHEMLGEAEHHELLDALLACRAAVVLSGYPSQLYDSRLTGWARREFLAGTGQSAVGRWANRTEVVWSNRAWAAPEQLDLFGPCARHNPTDPVPDPVAASVPQEPGR